MLEPLARLTKALSDRYEVERELGAGGMATVYLAEDVKHHRKVALKVLRPELAAVLGADRFVQEIETTAHLQHPNILPLFDSGEADGFLYYVMPFVDGETLRDMLNRETQLSIEAAIQIAKDVADALDAAHADDVIHRDIKPENILLHKGRAMVTDFGIALAVSAAAGGRMTETGLSLGTPHYMSPEQATAQKDLTGRSDVYSLGAVTYEMLAGEPPHTGGTAQQVIAKIVTEDVPSVAKARKTVPPNVAAAVTKALAKIPADRFDSAAGFADALTNMAYLGPTTKSGGGASATHASSGNRLTTRALGMAGVLMVMAAWGWLRPIGEVEKTATRFTVPVVDGHLMASGQFPQLALSPDGRRLVYTSGGQLMQRSLDRFESEPLPRTEGGASPFFSPDGEWVGFSQGGVFRRTSSSGGPVTDLAVGAGPSSLGASWGEDGNIVFAGRNVGKGIRRIQVTGGVSEVVTVVDSGSESAHAWPQVLDDGNLVLFTVIGRSGLWEDSRIVLQDVGTGEQVIVADNGTFGRYVKTGHVVYAQADGTILAVPFNLRRREVVGPPFPVEASVRVGYWGGAASFAVSNGGTFAFVRGSTWAMNELWWVNRQGQRLNRIGTPLTSEEFDLSPLDSQLVTALFQPTGNDIFVLDTNTGERTRITFDGGHWTAIWDPHGNRVAYHSTGASQPQIHIKELNSNTDPILVHQSEFLDYPSSWSPDGAWIAFAETDPESRGNVYAKKIDGSDSLVAIAAESGNEDDAQFSPDGRWVAYHSDGDGLQQVYVVSFPGIRGKRQISTNGGRQPVWSASGDELFFWSGDTLMVARITVREQLEAETPQPLFVLSGMQRGYDVTADGNRFVVHMASPDASANEIHLVMNFFAALTAMANQ